MPSIAIKKAPKHVFIHAHQMKTYFILNAHLHKLSSNGVNFNVKFCIAVEMVE